MPAVRGVQLATAQTGMNYRSRDDILLAVCAPQTSVAGVLTNSALPGAPVEWCRRQLHTGEARALLVNAGCANAFTGARGVRDVETTCAAAAAAIGCAPEEVLAASTGVIGAPLMVKKITDALPRLTESLADDNWARAANAIITTDTYPKMATATAAIAGEKITINGLAKGSGMIEPNMATLLAFVFTDAALQPAALQNMLAAACENSFNALTVDGETSTSDMCLAFATGAAGNPQLPAEDPGLRDFHTALQKVMRDLAILVARDGEGARKLITVEVRGAATPAAAKIIAKSIANSPLVKTAVAGEDANWGRVVMAIGKCGQRVDAARLEISIGGVAVTAAGRARDDFDETSVAQHLRGNEILIAADLHLGGGAATVWTCDLTRGYIDINADYRS